MTAAGIHRRSRRARWSAVLQGVAGDAFGVGEYIGQESFVSACEVLALALAAGITRETRVADLCCGVAGPGRMLAACTGCRLVGIDRSSEALHLAIGSAKAAGLEARVAFVAGDAARAPLAPGFDVALLLETMVSIEDKASLLREVRRLLPPGGRFALTLEVGCPLSPAERRAMPDGESIWLIDEPELRDLFKAEGYRLRSLWPLTESHAGVAGRLADAFACHERRIVASMGRLFWTSVIAAHRQWAAWLISRRVEKLAIVAERGA